MNNDTLAWILGSIIILAICAYPFYKAYTVLSKRRLLWFILFLLHPVIIDLAVVLLELNTLLANGVLANYRILGSPILVAVWTALVIVIFALSRKHIYTILH